jgi:hypothetical protein
MKIDIFFLFQMSKRIMKMSNSIVNNSFTQDKRQRFLPVIKNIKLHVFVQDISFDKCDKLRLNETCEAVISFLVRSTYLSDMGKIFLNPIVSMLTFFQFITVR